MSFDVGPTQYKGLLIMELLIMKKACRYIKVIALASALTTSAACMAASTTDTLSFYCELDVSNNGMLMGSSIKSFVFNRTANTVNDRRIGVEWSSREMINMGETMATNRWEARGNELVHTMESPRGGIVTRINLSSGDYGMWVIQTGERRIKGICRFAR